MPQIGTFGGVPGDVGRFALSPYCRFTDCGKRSKKSVNWWFVSFENKGKRTCRRQIPTLCQSEEHRRGGAEELTLIFVLPKMIKPASSSFKQSEYHTSGRQERSPFSQAHQPPHSSPQAKQTFQRYTASRTRERSAIGP